MTKRSDVIPAVMRVLRLDLVLVIIIIISESDFSNADSLSTLLSLSGGLRRVVLQSVQMVRFARSERRRNHDAAAHRLHRNDCTIPFLTAFRLSQACKYTIPLVDSFWWQLGLICDIR